MTVEIKVRKNFNYIDLDVYEIYQDEYGYDHERCIFATHGEDKKKVLEYVDDWENDIKRYAQELRKQIEELDK